MPSNENSPQRIKIRPASAADAALVLSFIRDLAKYEKLSDEVTAGVTDIEQSLFSDRPGAEVVIAEWDDQAAGFALYFSNYSTFIGRRGLHLEDLFVREEFRGLGIGKALLRHVAGIATERGCTRLDWVVLDWNEPAIRFYESIGARGLRDWVHFRLDNEALSALAD